MEKQKQVIYKQEKNKKLLPLKPLNLLLASHEDLVEKKLSCFKILVAFYCSHALFHENLHFPQNFNESSLPVWQVPSAPIGCQHHENLHSPVQEMKMRFCWNLKMAIKCSYETRNIASQSWNVRQILFLCSLLTTKSLV